MLMEKVDEGKAPKGDGGLKSIEPECLNELLDTETPTRRQNLSKTTLLNGMIIFCFLVLTRGSLFPFSLFFFLLSPLAAFLSGLLYPGICYS